MFSIGSSEIIILILFIVVLLGPKKIPEIARMMGKLMGSARKISQDFKDEISKGADSSEPPIEKNSELYKRTYEPTEPYKNDPYRDIDKDKGEK